MLNLICEQEKLNAMFDSITWGQYITTVVLLLVCYYIFIGFRFFRWELLSLIGIKKMEDNSLAISTVSDFKRNFEAEKHEDYFPKPVLEIDISPVVQSFTDEVKAYLTEADIMASKAELLHSLQLIVLKYPVLQEADYKHELVDFLFIEANAKFPNLLQQDDVKQLLT